CPDEPLFSGVTESLKGISNKAWWASVGELQAKWLMGKTDGAVKLLNVEFNDAGWGPWMTEGRLTMLESCADCEVLATIQLSNADVATGALGQKLASALLQYP